MKSYTVKLDGVLIPIYKTMVSAMPFNKVWNGSQRTKSQTEQAYFVTIDIEKESSIEITVNQDFQKYETRPSYFKIPNKREKNTVTLTVTKPMQFTFEVDGYHNALHIFVNPKAKKCPKEVIYYGKGIHDVGLIWLESNQTLYIDEGAIVHGVIFAKDVHDVKIMGRGILDSSKYPRYNDRNHPNRSIYTQLYEKGVDNEGFSETGTICSNLVIHNSKNILVEGITFVDSMFWSLIVRNHCENITIDNIKIIGQWRYNSDGIDICASKNITVKNSFIRSFDDCFVARGAYLPGETEDVENIVIENCVMWCDWGKSLEVWCGDVPCAIRNITFKNNYLIRLCEIAISITTWYGSSDTLIENISYENIYIDGDNNYRNTMIESEKNPEYIYKPNDFTPSIVNISAPKYKIGKNTGNQSANQTEDFSDYNLTFRNISFKNVRYTGTPLKVIVSPEENLLEIYNIYANECDFEI